MPVSIDESPRKRRPFAELSDKDKVRFYEYEFHVRFLITDDEGQLRYRCLHDSIVS